MSASTKFSQLLDAVRRSTTLDRLHWKATEYEDTFAANLGGRAVLRIGRDHGAGFTVELLDTSDRALEVEIFDPEDSQYDVVESLFKDARSKALEIDNLIEGVIQAIG